MENETQQIDYTSAASKMGYKALDDYGPNYGQGSNSTNDGIHPIQFTRNTEKSSQEAGAKPGDGKTAELIPGEALDADQLRELGVADADFETIKPIVGKLSKDETSRLMELHKQALDRQAGELSAQSEKWVGELEAEYGDGLETAADDVNDLLKRYDQNQELVNLLKRTGAQNCAPLFSMLHRISKDLRRRR